DLGGLDAMPVYEPVSHLVNVAGRDDVTDVWIGGERIVNTRTLATVDESALAARASAWQQRLC
ncbi:MAG: TRZ/ATZ family hydrolase, partial [Casimicrobiaceae bacterium]